MHLFHRDADFWLRARGECAGVETELDGDRCVQAGTGVADRDEAWYLHQVRGACSHVGSVVVASILPAPHDVMNAAGAKELECRLSPTPRF